MTAAVSTPSRTVRSRPRGSYWKRYRHALWLLTTRDLRVRYTTSKLGYVWSIVDPLMMALIYWVVFSYIYPRREDLTNTPYIVFLLCGVLPWTWFNGNLTDATRAFRQEGKLIRSVKIPRSIWVLRQVFSKGIEFVISLTIIAFFALVTGKAPSPMTLVYLPLAILLQIILTMGCNFVIAPLSVFFHDLDRIVRLTMRALFYGAPVLYHPLIGDPVLHAIYGINPLAGIFDLYRGCFFPESMDWSYVVEGSVTTVILFTIGTVVFQRNVPRALKEI